MKRGCRFRHLVAEAARGYALHLPELPRLGLSVRQDGFQTPDR